LETQVVEIKKPVDQRIAERLPVISRMVYVAFPGLLVVDETGIARVSIQGVYIGFGGEVVLGVDLLHDMDPRVPVGCLEVLL